MRVDECLVDLDAKADPLRWPDASIGIERVRDATDFVAERIVPGDIAAQTRRVLDNIGAVLKAEDLTFDHVVKTTIFLTNLGDFQTVNEVYGSYFKQDPPARSTIQVAALPKGANVEIEVIAIADQVGSTARVAYDTSG